MCSALRGKRVGVGGGEREREREKRKLRCNRLSFFQRARIFVCAYTNMHAHVHSYQALTWAFLSFVCSLSIRADTMPSSCSSAYCVCSALWTCCAAVPRSFSARPTPAVAADETICTFVCFSVCMYVCMYVCMHVQVYFWALPRSFPAHASSSCCRRRNYMLCTYACSAYMCVLVCTHVSMYDISKNLQPSLCARNSICHNSRRESSGANLFFSVVWERKPVRSCNHFGCSPTCVL